MEQLLNYFTPKNYRLDLNVDKNKKLIKGIVTLTGTPSSDFFKLHAVSMTIESVKIDGENHPFTHENNEITINDVYPKEIKVEISYRTPLNDNMVGAYLSTYEFEGKEEHIVATQFESHYARECFHVSTSQPRKRLLISF